MHELTELQNKVAYLEDTLDTLNDIIAKQDRQLTDLQDQLKILYRRLENGEQGSEFDVVADRPPHY